MTILTPLHAVDQIFELLTSRPARASGGDRVGLTDHSLQCAHELEKITPDDLELQVAGLVHDIGHIEVPDAADAHGVHGRDLVTPLLGERVGKLVELHVPAKRWMVTTDPEYRLRLSAASLRTLTEQGDLMDAAERAAFEAEPFKNDAIMLRLADDAAKTPGRLVPGLDYWRPVVAEVAAASGSASRRASAERKVAR
jgi:predicted HD phosphohydrolase